jgi:hypothetical protein
MSEQGNERQSEPGTEESVETIEDLDVAKDDAEDVKGGGVVIAERH